MRAAMAAPAGRSRCRARRRTVLRWSPHGPPWTISALLSTSSAGIATLPASTCSACPGARPLPGCSQAELILVTPLWLSNAPLRIDAGGPLGAYRIVSPRAFEAAWRGAAPEHARRELIPDGWFEAWEKVTLATDPGSPHDGAIRAPSGAVQDVRVHWTAGNPLYDPGEIACPTLVLAAEWDADVRFDMAHDLFTRLARAPSKRLVEIGQGTHMILMERNRRQAFDAVIQFLDERPRPAS